MPLDPRIPMMAQGVQLPDQMDALSKLANIQGMQAQNRLVGLKEQEYQRSVDTQNRLAVLAPRLANPKERAAAMAELPFEIQEKIGEHYSKLDKAGREQMKYENDQAASLLASVLDAPPQERAVAYESAIQQYATTHNGELPAGFPPQYSPQLDPMINQKINLSLGAKELISRMDRQATLKESNRHNVAMENRPDSSSARLSQKEDETGALWNVDSSGNVVSPVLKPDGTQMRTGVMSRSNVRVEGSLRDDARADTTELRKTDSAVTQVEALLKQPPSPARDKAIQATISKVYNPNVRALAELESWRNFGDLYERTVGGLARTFTGEYTQDQIDMVADLISNARGTVDQGYDEVNDFYRGVSGRSGADSRNVVNPSKGSKDVKPPSEMSDDELLKQLGAK